MITIDNQKECSICKEWKPATNEFFGNQKKGALGLTSRCRSCENKNSRNWRENNPEKKKELDRKWRENNPEKAKELVRNWRENNSKRMKELQHKWKKANPEKLAANTQQRRALKANADGTATAEQIKARFQYHENRCYYCGDNESGLHVEHRIPLSRGGSNWPANLVPACQSCNFTKHTKTEKEFLQ